MLLFRLAAVDRRRTAIHMDEAWSPVASARRIFFLIQRPTSAPASSTRGIRMAPIFQATPLWLAVPPGADMHGRTGGHHGVQ